MKQHDLETLLGVIYLLRRENPEFPIQYTLCLLEIAYTPGISLTQLSQRTELGLSTVSRIISALSSPNKPAAPGKKTRTYGFVEVNTSAQERRRKELHLSLKGKRLVENLTQRLQQNEAPPRTYKVS